MRVLSTYRLAPMALFLAVMVFLVAGSARAQIADTSDAFFSIVIPEAAARDVDMGTVLLGNARDTLVHPFFRNIGVVPIRIDSLYFEGVAAGDFALIAGRPPLRLATAAEEAAGFSFTPTAEGMRQAAIVVITQDDTLRYTIRGMGVRPSVAVVAGMVTSTVLTLVVIPMVYTLFSDLAAWVSGRQGATPAPAAPTAEPLPVK